MIQMFEKVSTPDQFATLIFFISGCASLPHKLAKGFNNEFVKPVQ